MTNKPKAIGTRTESAIVRYLLANGFDHEDETRRAQRITLHGRDDEGDVSVCPGVMVEAKGGHAAEQASDAQLAAWLVETERERRARGCDFAALVTKRKGKGDANAGQWWAFLPGWAFVALVALATGQTVALDRIEAPAVRITLADAATLFRRAGYGDPLP